MADGNAKDGPQIPQKFDVKSSLDHGTRIATVKVAKGLALPQEVEIPFVAIKHIAANIIMGEVVAESSGTHGSNIAIPQPGPVSRRS